MDVKNPFHTPGTYRLARAEHVAVVAACGAALLAHAGAVEWGRAAAAFWVIDVVGYLPGAIAYRRQGGGRIAPVYHYLYNAAHTYVVLGPALALWAWAIGGVEWAMLAVPLHISLDRGVFGNLFKPRGLAFEPVAASPDVVAAALGRPAAAATGRPTDAAIPAGAAADLR